ncbi:hypothetical protein [Leptothermofonsia sp. ETS-13]|uniref:hypothetical protein n=1 Tax=Leptothermofonsia sp. ETS-13 TaxID=3035696 RepID=UPI003B9FCC58
MLSNPNELRLEWVQQRTFLVAKLQLRKPIMEALASRMQSEAGASRPTLPSSSGLSVLILHHRIE